MEVDWPHPKRRRRASLDGRWWGAPSTILEDSALWGLCDALALYAHGLGMMSAPASPPELGSSNEDGIVLLPRFAESKTPRSGSLDWQSRLPDSQECPEIPGLLAPTARGTNGATVSTGAAPEPLLRALTQLANAAAVCTVVRRQLVVECQVHAPLLRLMQDPWVQDKVVLERCCRLLHWLCTQTPENREILAAHRCPSTRSGVKSVSFTDAVLSVAQKHPQNRDVLANALRALAALLPCSQVREELLRTQPQLLTFLILAGEALDQTAIRSICRWFPSVASQVRRACGHGVPVAGNSGIDVPCQAHGTMQQQASCADSSLSDKDGDVEMVDV